MKSLPGICLIFALSVVAFSCTHLDLPDPGQKDSIRILDENVIEQARFLYFSGNLQGVIDNLEPVEWKGTDSLLVAQRHWFLGKSYFLSAESRTKGVKEEGHWGFGLIDNYQVFLLASASENLIAAATTKPDAEFSAEAYYLAGKCMDHGYLQDFHKAVELYRWTALSYPQSEFGQKAASRLKDLEEKY